jgi:molybdenum cofactor cytidylyltransferase
MPQTAILILAAGASSRMGRGRDKLMQDANGIPLLARVIARAVATGLPLYVTIPGPNHPRANLVRDGGGVPVIVTNWADGMSASIQAGLAALPNGTPGVMILPGDMPDLQSKDLQDIAHTAQTNPAAIIRATADDATPGHPVVFPADLFGELANLSGDAGARAVIAAHKNRLILHALPGTRALVDLDTQADWDAWNATHTTDK